MYEDLIKEIEQKYRELGENPETYLKGLLHSKPLNYWDYVEVETLLSLQKPRTGFKDEEIFIMYHQVTELVLKLMLHEIKQISGNHSPDVQTMATKIERIVRYTSMLITSFDIMKDGMDYDDYNTFRATLAPASGFQSAQFRLIELYCTPLENLVNIEGRKRLPANPSIEDYFEHIYWKDAGQERKTGKKTFTLRQFEDKYMQDFIRLAYEIKGNTIADKVAAMDEGQVSMIKAKLREFDRLYNVEWPLVHLNTARHYLDSRGENKAATGGSQWKKYLHPHFQQRKFFPMLWSGEETLNWGGPGNREASTGFENKTIAGLVSANSQTAAVFSKYGIDFCCKGNKSLKEVLKANNVPSIQLLEEIKTIFATNTTASQEFIHWPLDLLIDYIEKKHHRYVEERVPAINQFLVNLNSEVEMPELPEIAELFKQAGSDLAAHMKKEELMLFPLIRKMLKQKESPDTHALEKIEKMVFELQKDHELEGDRFAQIENLLSKLNIKSEGQDYLENLSIMLKEFQEDLKLHIHLENNILFPKVMSLNEKPSPA